MKLDMVQDQKFMGEPYTLWILGHGTAKKKGNGNIITLISSLNYPCVESKDAANDRSHWKKEFCTGVDA